MNLAKGGPPPPPRAPTPPQAPAPLPAAAAPHSDAARMAVLQQLDNAGVSLDGWTLLMDKGGPRFSPSMDAAHATL